MSLVDKLGHGVAVGIGLVAGVMPQPVYSDGVSDSSYGIKKAAERGNANLVRHLIQVDKDANLNHARAEEEAKRKAREAAERKAEEDLPQITPIQNSSPVRFFICEDYEKDLVELSRSKNQEFKLGIRAEFNQPYETAILIKNRDGNVIGTKQWKNEAVPVNYGTTNRVSCKIIKTGQYKIEFLAMVGNRTIKETRTLIIRN